MPDPSISRRDLFAGAAAMAAVSAVPSMAAASLEAESAAPRRKGRSMVDVPFEPRREVAVGIIGVGGRGMSLLADLLKVPGARVKAICDVVRGKVVQAQKACMDAGQPEPTGYWRGEKDFEELCRRGDLDLVLVATPWDWHVRMAVSALKGGAHVGLEVPSAQTIDECWELVQVSEETQKHCIMLENCCYGYWEMTVWQMVHQGLLGTLTHSEAAYIHDLRGILLGAGGEGMWRWKPHVERDGNFYPTHGLGPCANYFDVNRGDRFASLVSMSSLEAALSETRDAQPPAEEDKRKARFRAGDMNTSIIRTEMGRTIMLQHDVVTPRPYSRLNLVQGTKGCFADYPARLALEEVSGGHRWLTDDEMKARRAEFEHPLWKKVGELARQVGGHGGMDYIMLYRLIDCMKRGLAPDIDVYDLAAWAAPVALSEASVKRGGAVVKFPDFTRGRWKEDRTTIFQP
ncbi:MAG: Gfo/Idh/MocA family oxidoreductase [Fimbriimonadaceae bacterium]|nr:Gfo/Idh/MocA family oxidoreductase [Fimbriimonadaceae bacterium]